MLNDLHLKLCDAMDRSKWRVWYGIVEFNVPLDTVGSFWRQELMEVND